MMHVMINGVKYIPAKEALANRDAVIRGLLENFWGKLGDSYNEDDKCEGIYVEVTDSPRDASSPTVQEVADVISEYSKPIN